MDHSEFHRPTWPALLVGVAAFLLISIAGRAQGELSVRADDPRLSASARAVPHDGTLRLESLFLETRGEMDLELTRFPVFTDDAVILAGEKSIQVPEHAYFRGSVVGLPSSRAVLSFKTSGVIDGLIISDGELWHLSSRAQQAGLSGLRLDILEENADRPFECQTDRLGSSVPVSLPESLMPGAESSQPRAVSYSYSARVAVDTDWEFLNKFGGDVNAATDYVGDLFAFSSAIYEDEVDTSLHVSYLKWWPGPDNGSDPWSQSGCSSALSQFRSYWNSNHGSTERTVAHLMSGKNTGCGIAYVGVLCNASYGYGVTGSLSGNFDPLDPMSGSGFWDILAVSHEIGHNFGSSHTHCYQGVPNSGYPDSVDHCYDSTPDPGDPSPPATCYQGPASLPQGCSAGDRCGTIMSYCHLRSGGYGNISLTFGQNHPHGVDAWRVPSVMNSHVVSRAQSYPSCLSVIVPDLIFEDDFESGATAGWDEAVE